MIGIAKVYPDVSGSKLFVIDERSDGFIYNPVNSHYYEVRFIYSTV